MRRLRLLTLLLDGDALGEVSWPVDVAATKQGDVVGQKLQRDGRDQRLQKFVDFRNVDDIVGHLFHTGVAFAGDRDDCTSPSFYFFEIAHDLWIDAALWDDEDAWRFFINQGDRSVFHFRSRVAFRVDVADFFQLESTFECGRKVVQPTEVQKVVEAVVLVGDSLNLLMTLQGLLQNGRHVTELVEHSLAGRVGQPAHSAKVDGQ